jgi:hypothetical protein
MRSRVLTVCLSLACVAADLAIAPLAIAADVDSEQPSYGDVAIDTSKLGADGPVIQQKIRERADVVLRERGVLPPRDAADPIIEVSIVEITGEHPGYAYRVDVVRAGEPAATSAAIECGLCTEGELVKAVAARIERAVATLDDAPTPAAVPPPRVDPRTTSPTTDRAEPPVHSPALRITGVTLAGIGGAALIPGAILAAREPKPKPDMPLEETNTRPAGYAVLGVGIGLVVTGAVLLIVDARRRSRARTATVARVR